MSDQFADDAKSFEALSALADGEASEREIAQACTAWRGHSVVRERWQSYQLIGDVMRSESLAQTRSSDADFLDAFRARLAQEPVVFAPAALATPAASALDPVIASPSLHRRRWVGPAAVAAGFVMVLGGLMTVLQTGGDTASPMLAQAPADQGAVAAAGWVGQEAALAPGLRHALVADSSMASAQAEAASSSFRGQATPEAGGRPGSLVVIRDAQLDQFLAAHRELASANAFAPTAGLVRGVAFEAPAP